MSFPKNSSKTTFEVFTDGGCSGNPGLGGWAYHINVVHGSFRGDWPLEGYGAVGFTTNNRMELLSVIKGLSILKTLIGAMEAHVLVLTDSTYVKNGITDWINKWRNNGWITANKKSVKNKELWVELDALVTALDITFDWVRGHSGHPGNERCHDLVQLAITSK